MTVSVERVDSKGSLREFIDLPRRIYADCEQWVPMFDLDYRSFYRRRHPFFALAKTEFLLVRRFEHRAAMTMMAYNHAYYADHYERHGFSKHFDLFSLLVDPSHFALPEKVERLAEHVRRRGRRFHARLPRRNGSDPEERGRLTPLSVLRLLHQSRNTNRLILNGMGILEKYQRLGADALIYSEIGRTIGDTASFDFAEAELVQINEETDLMLSDMHRLGARTHKIHRVFILPLEEKS